MEFTNEAYLSENLPENLPENLLENLPEILPENLLENLLENDQTADQEQSSTRYDDELLDQTQDILDNIKPEDIEKYKEFQKVILAMGIPSCKIMLNTLISKATGDAMDISVMKQKVEELTINKQAGGMQINYFNPDIGKNTYAYIIMNKCTKDHDIVYQISKIQKYIYKGVDENNIPNPEWQEVLKYISMMIYLCRNIYETTSKVCKQEIENLKILNEDGSPKDINLLMQLEADPVTTIIHLVPEWEERLGIYIMTEDELEGV